MRRGTPGRALHARGAGHHRPDHRALQPEGMRPRAEHPSDRGRRPGGEARRRRRGRPACRRRRRSRARARRRDRTARRCVTGRTRIGRAHAHLPVRGDRRGAAGAGVRRTRGLVEIGSDNEIREHVTIHVGIPSTAACTRSATTTWCMNGVHIAHDCRIGSHCVLASMSGARGPRRGRGLRSGRRDVGRPPVRAHRRIGVHRGATRWSARTCRPSRRWRATARASSASTRSGSAARLREGAHRDDQARLPPALPVEAAPRGGLRRASSAECGESPRRAAPAAVPAHGSKRGFTVSSVAGDPALGLIAGQRGAAARGGALRAGVGASTSSAWRCAARRAPRSTSSSAASPGSGPDEVGAGLAAFRARRRRATW